MKINKNKLIQIINEEMDMMQTGAVGHKNRDINDPEGKMARSQLEHIAKYAMEVHQMLEPYGDELQLESWVQNKLSIAEDYLSKIKHFLENELNANNDLPSEV